MPDYKSANISVTLPEHIEISDQAGNLSANQIKRMPKPCKRGVGTLCTQLAEVVDASPEFVEPELISAELLEIGAKAEDIKPYVHELETLLKQFKQQSLLYDSAAYALVRQVNNLVKAQVKNNPKIKNRFFLLTNYFERGKKQHTTDVPDAPDTLGKGSEETAG